VGRRGNRQASWAALNLTRERKKDLKGNNRYERNWALLGWQLAIGRRTSS